MQSSDATPPVYIGMTGTISGTHVYSDNGTYVVTICTSDDTVEVCDTFTVTVTNALPAVTAALGGGSLRRWIRRKSARFR